MVFNPPPGWPLPPGWHPPAGWVPDPSWPPAPDGWSFWVEESPGVPAPGPDAGVPAPGPDAGVPVPPPAPGADAAATRGPLLSFFGGLALVLVGAGSFLFSSGPRGGYLLYGALFFGAVLVFRSVMAYRAARSDGAPALARPVFAVAAVALVGAVAFTGYAGLRQVATIGLSDTAGSCWEVDGDELFLVPCTAAHDYVALSEEADPMHCPARAEGWVDTERSTVLCLAPA